MTALLRRKSPASLFENAFELIDISPINVSDFKNSSVFWTIFGISPGSKKDDWHECCCIICVEFTDA
jgi:hypothetical protein